MFYRSKFIGLPTFRDRQGLFIAGRTGLLAGRWSRQKWARKNPANMYATSRSDGARASCCLRPRRATFLTQKSTRSVSRTATGHSSDQPAVLSAISWRTYRSPIRTTCCSWTAFTTLSRSSTCWRKKWESWLRALSCQAASTTPSVSRRLTEHGRYKFWCRGGLYAWKAMAQ